MIPTRIDKVFYRNTEHKYVWPNLTFEQTRGIVSIYNPDTLEDLSLACSFIIDKDKITIIMGVLNIPTGDITVPKYDRLFVSIVC